MAFGWDKAAGEPRGAGRFSGIWITAAAILAPGTLLAGALEAVALDAFVRRPAAGGSMTTLMPGAAYASATVMKVCVVMGMVSAAIAFLQPAQPRGVSTYAIISIMLPSVALLIPPLFVMTAQAVVSRPAGPSLDDLSQFSRSAVLIMVLVMTMGAALAVMSLVRLECPRLLGVFGLITNTLLIALFWYFDFHAPGFDQDLWSPRRVLLVSGR
jgi:hypothetical protein